MWELPHLTTELDWRWKAELDWARFSMLLQRILLVRLVLSLKWRRYKQLFWSNPSCAWRGSCVRWRKSVIWVADDFLSLENPGWPLILSTVTCNQKKFDQYTKCPVQCCKGLVSGKPRISWVSKNVASSSACQVQSGQCGILVHKEGCSYSFMIQRKELAHPIIPHQ